MKYAAGLTAAALMASALLVAAPATAANASLTFSYQNLSTSTPGHVTGTVSSDQPYVWVRLRSNVPATKLTLSGGTANFDLETWGYGDAGDGKITVEGVACPADPPTEASCSELVTSARFTPHEITPQVTWFTDTTIGPGQDATVTVSDAGGGTLRWGLNGPVIAHNGTTTLDVDDDTTNVSIVRCSTANAYNCSDANFTTSLSRDLQVRRTLTAESNGNIVTGQQASTTVDVGTSANGTYALSWYLQAYDMDSGTLIPGTSGPTQTASGTLVNRYAEAVPVNVSGLSDGAYLPVATITVTDPDFGTYANVPVVAGGIITVDRTAADITAFTPAASTIYPLIKSAKRPGNVKLTVTGNFTYQEKAQIRNSVGAVIAEPTLEFESQNKATLVWDGTNAGGTPQAAGSYTVVVLDGNGNVSPKTAKIAVSGLRLVTKTFTKTVTARSSLVDQYVGKCSQLRKPSLRGWSGSLGFYANTKCHKTSWKASAVSTVHAISLPAADRYLDVRVNTYGGAAKARKSSTAGVRYLTTNGGWVADRLLTKKVGWHPGATWTANGIVFSDRSFGWGIATAAKDRYDVKSFTVVVRYQTLG